MPKKWTGQDWFEILLVGRCCRLDMKEQTVGGNQENEADYMTKTGEEVGKTDIEINWKISER